MRCIICSREHSATEACADGADAEALGATFISTPVEPPAAQGRDLSGQWLGELLLVRRLGQGGMGTVYLAEARDGRPRAVKVLHPALAADRALLARFRAEALAASRIDHPAVVAVEDMGFAPPDLHFLVMEYLQGHPLSLELKGRPLAVPRVRALLEQVLSGLEAAHVRGVVHRDLKPDNLFLLPTADGSGERVKILDFGVAKLLDTGVPLGQTLAGTLVGTPEYMAPEQVAGAEVDGRCDVYALGIIAYQLVTGQLPFTGPTLMAVLMAHQQQAPVPPGTLNPELPQALSDVILRALAKRPEDRFASAGAFREALQLALGRRRGAGTDSLPPAPALAAEAPSASPSAPPEHPSPARPPLLFLVRLSIPGQPARSLPCLQLTRGGGMLLSDEGGRLPPRTRLSAVLELSGGGAPATVEVVGHVDATQARAWGTAAGHWVQLVEARGEVRAQLEVLARGGSLPTPRPAPAAAPAPEDPLVDRLLAPLGPAVGTDPYRVLGLPLDAPFDRVRARVRELQQTLASVHTRRLSPRQRTEQQAASERLERAASLLATPAARLHHDADRGNWAGVARCIAAGVTATELAQARAAFLGRHLGAEARSRIHQVTASAWEARGDTSQALAEYERALTVDPLHLELHQRYWPLRQRGAPARKGP